MTVDSFDPNLIYDVGMHVGKDTGFYLRKGFRVVAIEANPDTAARVTNTFKTEIAEGRLTIINKAVAETAGTMDLYTYGDLSETNTLFPDAEEQIMKFGRPTGKVTVQTSPITDIMREHGVPYYLKIDIEGADLICLKSIAASPFRPRYISVESNPESEDMSFELLSTLWNIGYKGFKISNQARVARKMMKTPNPAREGKTIDFRFGRQMSGPFGDELEGRWRGILTTAAKFRGLCRERALFSRMGGTHKNTPYGMAYWVFKWLLRRPVGWYDFHARYGEPEA